MLHAYYDCRTKHKFQQWFGNLWIGCYPTPLQGKYQVLHLDFSQVGGTIDTLEEKFNFYMGVQLDGFVHDGIEAERNLQGFFMAYLSLNTYYYTAPELELNHGNCDFFLLPDLTHNPTKHSYILELKLIPKKEKGMTKKAHEAKITEQWNQDVAQIDHYAEGVFQLCDKFMELSMKG